MKHLNKKAQGLNYIAVILFLLIFGFVNMFAYVVWIEFVSGLTASGFNTGVTSITVDAFTRGFQAFDYVIILLMVVFGIGIGLTSFKIATSATFFIITLIMGIFWGFIAYFFNYVFIQLISPAVFATAWGVFPRTMLLCTNLHWIALLYIIIGSLTLYAKREQGQYLT